VFLRAIRSIENRVQLNFSGRLTQQQTPTTTPTTFPTQWRLADTWTCSNRPMEHSCWRWNWFLISFFSIVSHGVEGCSFLTSLKSWMRKLTRRCIKRTPASWSPGQGYLWTIETSENSLNFSSSVNKHLHLHARNALQGHATATRKKHTFRCLRAQFSTGELRKILDLVLKTVVAFGGHRRGHFDWVSRRFAWWRHGFTQEAAHGFAVEHWHGQPEQPARYTDFGEGLCYN
jgi:hypothetical protein